jgi:hypothetical protein
MIGSFFGMAIGVTESVKLPLIIETSQSWSCRWRLRSRMEESRERRYFCSLTTHSTAEAVFFKVYFSLKQMFDLMLRLRKVEMEGQLLLHVVHVAGTRMTEEGADGVSRRDLTQGSMAGPLIINFVPLASFGARVLANSGTMDPVLVGRGEG